MPPSTVDAKILLGWMGREEAVSYLRNDCWFDPGLTDAQAEALWLPYKARVEALAERAIVEPQRFPIPAQHRQHVAHFLAKLKGPEVLDVINVDPMGLLVYQKYVVTDRADHHAQGNGDWARKSLVIERPAQQMPVTSEDGIVKIKFPHAEHRVILDNGVFRFEQLAGFISAAKIHGRLFLKAGYHRSFAFARAVKNEPDAKDRTLLVALTSSLPPELATEAPDQGLRTMVLGSRPPFFWDFFDCDLAMTVKLRKKRWEMHVKIGPVDDA